MPPTFAGVQRVVVHMYYARAGQVVCGKRIACVTMAVFLNRNGHEIDAPETEVVEVMVALAAGRLAEDELAGWLRDRIVPTS